jgi:hypothetical protein
MLESIEDLLSTADELWQSQSEAQRAVDVLHGAPTEDELMYDIWPEDGTEGAADGPVGPGGDPR